MSSSGAISGAGAGAPGGSGGRKRGRPLGSQNKVKDPAAMPPVPQRRGRPPGSRNKKTLEALAAATATEPYGAGRSTALTAAPGGAVALATAHVAAPASATSIAGLTRTPLEAAAALVGAGMAVEVAPPGLAGRASVAPPMRPPARHASPGACHLCSGSPTPRSTGTPPPWCTCWPGDRIACRSLPASSARWGKPPDEHHGAGRQRRPAPVPRRDPPR
jgi:hypothetical protein